MLQKLITNSVKVLAFLKIGFGGTTLWKKMESRGAGIYGAPPSYTIGVDGTQVGTAHC